MGIVYFNIINVFKFPNVSSASISVVWWIWNDNLQAYNGDSGCRVQSLEGFFVCCERGWTENSFGKILMVLI